MKNLTNTFKLTHRSEQNRSKNSYLEVEEFHTLHALSLQIFYLCINLTIIYLGVERWPSTRSTKLR
jgi:hypothetical protein